MKKLTCIVSLPLEFTHEEVQQMIMLYNKAFDFLLKIPSHTQCSRIETE